MQPEVNVIFEVFSCFTRLKFESKEKKNLDKHLSLKTKLHIEYQVISSSSTGEIILTFNETMFL